MDPDKLKVLCRYAQKSAGIRGEMRGKSCLLENIISCAILSQNKSIFIGSFAFFPKFWALSITEIEKEGKLGPASFHPRKFSEGLFRGKEVHWNIANPLDHAKAPGDVSSRDKSSGLTNIIVPENEMSMENSTVFPLLNRKNRSAKTETKKIRYQNQLDN